MILFSRISIAGLFDNCSTTIEYGNFPVGLLGNYPIFSSPPPEIMYRTHIFHRPLILFTAAYFLLFRRRSRKSSHQRQKKT
jgi:hypothetical protein